MRKIAVSLVIGLLLALARPSTQNRPLVAHGSTVEQLATGFGFLEGPAADLHGNLYFSDIPRERIHRWTPGEGVSTFREATGRANGLRFTPDGQLLVCEMGNRRVTAIDANGQMSILADVLQGRRFNSPNDLWVDPNGGIYFSDPRYGTDDDKEMDGDHVYYVSPDRTEVRRVADERLPSQWNRRNDGWEPRLCRGPRRWTHLRVYADRRRIPERQASVRQPGRRRNDPRRDGQRLPHGPGHHRLRPEWRTNRINRGAGNTCQPRIRRSQRDHAVYHRSHVALRGGDDRHRPMTRA